LLTRADVLSTITSTSTPRAWAAFRALKIGAEVKLYAWTKIERCAPAICSTTSSVQSWPGVKQTVQAGCSAWPAGAANRSAAARPAAIAKSVARDSPEYLRAIDYLGSPPRSTARPPLCSTPVPRPTSHRAVTYPRTVETEAGAKLPAFITPELAPWSTARTAVHLSDPSAKRFMAAFR
jgi:hypothetical protein